MYSAWAGAPLQIPSLNRNPYHICRDPSGPRVFYEWFKNTYQTGHLTHFSRNICLLSPGIDPGIELSSSLRLGKFVSSSERYRGLQWRA